jgi:hypothetical protein
VIVRISGEGQFRLPDNDAERLNDLDNEAVAAVESGDEDKFHSLFDQMLSLVESDGESLGDDELVESDVILPPRDVSFEEAAGEFTGDGLIPDSRAGPGAGAETPRGELFPSYRREKFLSRRDGRPVGRSAAWCRRPLAARPDRAHAPAAR